MGFIWGAGMIGRRLSKYLLRQGALIAFFDKPVKIGGAMRPVIPARGSRANGCAAAALSSWLPLARGAPVDPAAFECSVCAKAS
jgi:hypothetical protein